MNYWQQNFKYLTTKWFCQITSLETKKKIPVGYWKQNIFFVVKTFLTRIRRRPLKKNIFVAKLFLRQNLSFGNKIISLIITFLVVLRHSFQGSTTVHHEGNVTTNFGDTRFEGNVATVSIKSQEPRHKYCVVTTLRQTLVTQG